MNVYTKKNKKSSSRHVPYALCHVQKQGFSLVEVIVAVALFGLVVSIAAGGFITALRTQKQTAGLLLANSSVSLVLEQVAREIRTASDFCLESVVDHVDCTPVYTDPTQELEFVNAKGHHIIYSLNDVAGVLERTEDDGDHKAITPNNIKIRDFKVFLAGHVSKTAETADARATEGDGLAPRVTILISASTKIGGRAQESAIRLQATISARNLDG